MQILNNFIYPANDGIDRASEASDDPHHASCCTCICTAYSGLFGCCFGVFFILFKDVRDTMVSTNEKLKPVRLHYQPGAGLIADLLPFIGRPNERIGQ
jgi:hypothetical protein